MDSFVEENGSTTKPSSTRFSDRKSVVGWYSTWKTNCDFHIEARCTVSKVVSPLSKGETVPGPSHGTGGSVLRRYALADLLARPDIGGPLS
jgi:hypothetical protein